MLGVRQKRRSRTLLPFPVTRVSAGIAMEEIESGRATVAAVVGLGARNQPPPRQAHVRRRFTEIDLRRMLEYANGYHRDIVQGRWVIRNCLPHVNADTSALNSKMVESGVGVGVIAG